MVYVVSKVHVLLSTSLTRLVRHLNKVINNFWLTTNNSDKSTLIRGSARFSESNL